MKPERIFLIGYGKSISNIGRSIYYKLPGFKIPLRDEGNRQAIKCDKLLREKLVSY